MRHYEEILYCEVCEVLAQVAQRSSGFTIPGSGQGQVGWDTEQPAKQQVSLPVPQKLKVFKVPSDPNYSMFKSEAL